MGASEKHNDTFYKENERHQMENVGPFDEHTVPVVCGRSGVQTPHTYVVSY